MSCAMSDIRIAFYHNKEVAPLNEIYEFYKVLNNWSSNPAIIEEKIFHGDLLGGLNHCESNQRSGYGILPHLPHVIDSLSVRKVGTFSKYNYINNAIYDFDDPLLEHCDIFIINADVLVYLTDDEVEKLLSIDAPILLDATFEAFVFQYYYPILKIFNDKYNAHGKTTLLVGSNKYENQSNFDTAFKNYTGSDVKYIDFFRINETLVGSSGFVQSHEDNTINNVMNPERITKNFYAEKTKDFLCLNNRPRFHRMCLIEKLRSLGLLENNFVSRRWQYPAKEHIVQPLIAELLGLQGHSPRLLDELRIFDETPDSLIAKLKEHPNQIIIPEYEENIEVRTDKDNSTDLLDDRSFSPAVYEKSFFTIAVETYYEPSFIDTYPEILIEMAYKDHRAFLTEKVYKPIQYGHMFIPFGMRGTMRSLEKLGFENFHEEFNCYDDTYDWHDDDTKRYNVFIDIIKNFDKSRINDNTLEKILHNYNLFYSKEKIMNYIDSFFDEIL